MVDEVKYYYENLSIGINIYILMFLWNISGPFYKLVMLVKGIPGAYLRFKSPSTFYTCIITCCKSYPYPLSDLIKLQYLDTVVS